MYAHAERHINRLLIAQKGSTLAHITDVPSVDRAERTQTVLNLSWHCYP